MLESVERARREVAYPTTTEELWSILDAIEREVEERYIELPKDADGDVWRVGDLVVGEVNPSNPKRIERMLWYGTDSGWQLETDSIIYPYPERPRHYHALTVEDVLEEFASERIKLFLRMPMSVSDEGIEEYCKDNDEACEKLIAEYAERLQLREAE